MNKYPFDEVLRNAERMMRKGATIYQQFECTNCGIKQTIEDPNVFYVEGKCEECGKITNIKEAGCNFMIVMGKFDLGKGKKEN